MYDVQSPSRRLAVKERLYSLRMPQRKSLDLHLQDVNSIVAQLASLEVTIQDEDLVDQMLARSWSSFIEIHQGRDQSPTFSELQGSMLHKESSRLIDRLLEEILYAQKTNGPQRNSSFRDHRGGQFGR